jgi:hypothetical protein
MKATLRLGPIPKATPVRITIVVTAEFKSQLERYAELHARVWGDAIDAAELIPHMLRSFVDGDKAFRRAQKRKANAAEAD